MFPCRRLYLFFSSVLVFSSCYAPRTAQQAEARLYQNHTLQEDTSTLYQLPFAPDTRHRMIQGYYSRHTHKHKAAIDFKMKVGTPVYASRSGKVISTKSDSDKGGFNKKYRPDANYVMIEHEDSTRASYRHLRFEGVTVTQGQYIYAGQQIGYSGNTGDTVMPHLHISVGRFIDGRWVSIPTRFQSSKAAGYLRPLYLYTSINKTPDLETPVDIHVLAN